MKKTPWIQIFTVDPEEPLRAWLFTLLLAAVAAWLIWYTPLDGFNWLVVVFLGLIAVADSAAVILPHDEQAVSVGFALVYAGIVLFDPWWAGIAAGGGMAIAHIAHRRRMNIWLFNGAQIYLSTFGASYVYHWLMSSADAPGVLYRSLPVLALAALVYFALNIFFSTLSVSLAFSLPLSRLLVQNVRWAIPNLVVLWTIGVLMVYLLRSDAGIIGILLLWLPLLVVRYSLRQYVELKKTHIETIQSLAAALDAKDPYTRGHSQRVAEMARLVASAMQLPENEVEAVHYAGLLHDIGKIGVHDDVLNKVEKLTDEDWEKIRSHATIGADIVRHVRFLQGVSDMIRHHHESYDGTGYPDGLKGENIPIGARILAVCDAYDAMTTERPYRKALTPERAVAELKSKAGVQFDPRVVEAFLQVLPAPDSENPPPPSSAGPVAGVHKP